MCRIIFKNGAIYKRLKNLIQRNFLFDHFLLGMLCDAQSFSRSLIVDLRKDTIEIMRVNISHTNGS